MDLLTNNQLNSHTNNLTNNHTAKYKGKASNPLDNSNRICLNQPTATITSLHRFSNRRKFQALTLLVKVHLIQITSTHYYSLLLLLNVPKTLLIQVASSVMDVQLYLKEIISGALNVTLISVPNVIKIIHFRKIKFRTMWITYTVWPPEDMEVEFKLIQLIREVSHVTDAQTFSIIMRFHIHVTLVSLIYAFNVTISS